MNSSSLHSTVMRRVRIAYYLNILLSGTTLAGALLLSSLYLIGREVWVAKVFENMPSITEAAALVTFFVRAFMTTDFIVQALVMLALSAGIVFARSVGKMVVVGPRFA